MATVRVTIDGRPGSFADGTTILAAARQFGIEIPTLCDDPRLEPSGACRLCLVEVAGAAKPLAACAAPVADGMEIRTTSAVLEAERRAVLEMLARDYPAAADPRGSRQTIPPLPAAQPASQRTGRPRRRKPLTSLIPIFASTCRAASTAIAACASATICRDSTSGTSGTAAPRPWCTRQGRRCSRARAWRAAPAWTPVRRGALEDRSVLRHGAADDVDAHDLSVLRRRLRARLRHARRPDRRDAPVARRAAPTTATRA